MISIICDNIFNLAIKILSKAELFVVVAVCTQEDGKIFSASRKFCRAELLVEIASIEFLIAGDTHSIFQVLSISKFILAKSTNSSMEGRNWVVGQLR